LDFIIIVPLYIFARAWELEVSRDCAVMAPGRFEPTAHICLSLSLSLDVPLSLL
jgi:hypothetical protein